MYIIEQYHEVLGVDREYCKSKEVCHPYVSIENIEDLTLFIKYLLKRDYPGCILIEDSIFWNKEKKTVYFEYVMKYEDGSEDIDSDSLYVYKVEDINIVLDITKL